MIAHSGAWFLAPKYQPGLRLNEIFTAKVVVVQDHFIEIKPPVLEENSEKISEITPAEPVQRKVHKRKAKKVRRKVKRRRKKYSTPVKAKSPPVPKAIFVASEKPASVVTDNEMKSITHLIVSKPKSVVVEERTASTIRSKKLAKRLTRNMLRKIKQGYYKSLHSLMKTKKSYPRSAKMLGLEGTVLIEMVINKQGQILSVTLAQSSGHKLLDQAAIAQVQKIGKVPNIPKEIPRRSLTFQIPFEYILQS